MSKISNLMLQAAAGQAGGAGLDITDVFSTYLYTGNGSTQTITNGIDLAGEGGLVWIKSRSASRNHCLTDTARGAYSSLASNLTDKKRGATTVTSFLSSGFTIGHDTSDAVFANTTNVSGENYASWTFRKAPKFFDVVTYTGTGSPQTIAHNLGSVPGCIITKSITNADEWIVYHKDANGGINPEDYYAELNATAPFYSDTNRFNSTAPTDTHFSLGTSSSNNRLGSTNVAYLFAHNDGDGEFGPSGDQDIIKCGSYTGNGSTDGPEIDLGFEPQWVMVKRADAGSEHWAIIDSMRKMTSGESNNALMLKPNNSEAEEGVGFADPLPTGFKLSRNEGVTNASGGNYIYIAIRRGPLAQPESGTEVFAVDRNNNGTAPTYESGFPVDMGLIKQVDNTNSWLLADRLRGTSFLSTNLTNSETSNSTMVFDYMEGWNNFVSSSAYYSWMFRRAPSFFDVVAYTGNSYTVSGIGHQSVKHSLGVSPELIIVKDRANSSSWAVQTPNNKFMILNSVGLEYQDANTNSYYWGDGGGATGVVIVPTDTDFTVGPGINGNSRPFIAYLFATLDGVSKVGSYTGNGSSQTIDCGFTSGARFILIKRTDSTGDWYVWDTERGIVAGNDPHLSLNTTAAEVTSDDSIDPDNSGFIVNQVSATNINVSSASYIFYAVA